MNDLTFLDEELASEYGASDAILKAVLPGGKVVHISDAVSPFKFLDTCPLLYHAFEYNSQSRLQASIDASSETAVISLARYCYTGSYLAGEPDGESILLLQHAETYKIAEDFDVPELQIMAHGNFSCQIEYACCLPNPPKDLLETIRFLYRHFASDEARRKHNLVDTLLNYCVAVYLYHKLGESLDFLTAVHEISAFRQDLCRTNIARNFEDDCAADIIRLPSGPMISGNVHMPLASRELPSEMLYDLPSAPVPSNRPPIDRTTVQQKMDRIKLSYRRGVLGVETSRQGIPDKSKHCVSASALKAALERYSATTSNSDGADHAEESMQKYKRARIEEATARLEGWPLPSNAGSSSARHTTEDKSATIKVDEDSYWAGAFDQTKMDSRETPPGEHSARHSLVNYKHNSVPSTENAKSSHHTARTETSMTLPHRPHNPETPPSATAADSASEDEGFALIERIRTNVISAPHSPMSSPELVAAEGTAKARACTGNGEESEDEWTML